MRQRPHPQTIRPSRVRPPAHGQSWEGSISLCRNCGIDAPNIERAIGPRAEPTTMLCQQCGQEGPPNTALCTSCGSPLVASVMTCSQCQEPVSPSDRFCRSCGAENSQSALDDLTNRREPTGDELAASASEPVVSSAKGSRTGDRRSTPWLIAGGVVAAILIGGGAFAATRWSSAQGSLRDAASATQDGAYANATKDLEQAHATWPWLNVTSQLATVTALARSQANFRTGQADWKQGSFSAAIGYFAKVAPGAREYKVARSFIGRYHTAEAEGALVGNMEKDLQALATTVDTFTSDYDSGTTPLNAALQNYANGFGGLVADVTTFQADISQASSDANNLSVDSAAVQAAAATFASTAGVMEQSAVLNNGQLESLMATVSDETAQINAMAQAMGNAVTDTQNLANGNGLEGSVNNDISDGNAALAKLQSDEQTSLQELAAVYGYDKSAIDKVIGVANAASAFIPSSSSSSNGVS